MRFLIAAIGILGAQGVIVGAIAAHGGYEPYFKDMLDQAVLYQLIHLGIVFGTVFLTQVNPYLLKLTQGLFMGGIVLFCGTLYGKVFFDTALFPMSAPLGGMALIAGWISLGLCGLSAGLKRDSASS